MRIAGRDRRVITDELEDVVPELRQEAPASDGVEVALRGRLGEAIAESRRPESADLHHHLPRPVREVGEGKDHLLRGVGDPGIEEEFPVAAQQADVGVVRSGPAHGLPERQRIGEPVALVGQSFVPRSIRDLPDGDLQLVQIRLCEGKPARRPRVLALHHEAGHPQRAGVDPVVILEIFVQPPRRGQGVGDPLRLDADLVGDGGAVGIRQRLVDPVVGDRIPQQHVRFVQVRRALAVGPGAPARVSEQLRPRHRRVPGVAGELVSEGPDSDLVPEEPVIVVIGRRRRGVVDVLIEDGRDVRRDGCVRRLRGLPQGGDVGGAEEQRRVRSCDDCRDQGQQNASSKRRVPGLRRRSPSGPAGLRERCPFPDGRALPLEESAAPVEGKGYEASLASV